MGREEGGGGEGKPGGGRGGGGGGGGKGRPERERRRWASEEPGLMRLSSVERPLSTRMELKKSFWSRVGRSAPSMREREGLRKRKKPTRESEEEEAWNQ